MPQDQKISYNIQDPASHASENLHVNQQHAEIVMSPKRVVLEDITHRPKRVGPNQIKKQTKKNLVEHVNKAHLVSNEKENIPTQNHNGVDSPSLHEVDVQGESRGKWKRTNRANDHSLKPGFSSPLSGIKRSGSWSEEAGKDDINIKKGRSSACSSEQSADGDLAAAGVQPRRTQ